MIEKFVRATIEWIAGLVRCSVSGMRYLPGFTANIVRRYLPKTRRCCGGSGTKDPTLPRPKRWVVSPSERASDFPASRPFNTLLTCIKMVCSGFWGLWGCRFVGVLALSCTDTTTDTPPAAVVDMRAPIMDLAPSATITVQDDYYSPQEVTIPLVEGSLGLPRAVAARCLSGTWASRQRHDVDGDV